MMKKIITGIKMLHLIAVMLLLNACSVTTYTAPDVILPTGWATEGKIPNDSTHESSLIDKPWIEVFAIPELTALVDEALLNSSEIVIAVQRMQLAHAQLGIEKSALFPSANISLSTNRQLINGNNSSVSTISENSSFSLVIPSWEIDLWGKLAARNEAAQRELLASAALAQGVRISLTAQVAMLYFDLLDIDNQASITKRTLSGRKQSLRINRARFNEGISSLLDVRQAESLVASSEQALADQKRRQVLTENALSLLLGRLPGPIARSTHLDSLILPTETLAGLPSTLLQRRPDIRAAEESLRGATANVDVARKAFLPSITLTTVLGIASPGLNSLFESGRHAWSFQPVLGMPFFDGGRLRSGVALAEAQQRILIEQYKTTIRQAFREVNDSLVVLEQLKLQNEASLRVVNANRDRLKITRARYLDGIASYLDVLDAERQLFDSELGLSNLTRSQHQAVVQLYRALGGGRSVAE